MFTKFGMDKILKDIQDMYDKKRVNDLVNVSVKTKFLFELMAHLKKEGHRVLIFTMSKQMLDLLELMIANNPTYKKEFTY